MTVPFRDTAELQALGTAAFLRLIRGRTERERAAVIFVANARGEPVEFAFNHAQLPSSALWRPVDLERQAATKLIASLFSALRVTPTVIVCFASEVPVSIVGGTLEVGIPVARLSPEAAVSWAGAEPPAGSPGARLFSVLAAAGLLREPLERALKGAREAFLEAP